MKGLNLDNARGKGKAACIDLLEHRRITTSGNGNLYLTIYTPEGMQNTGTVKEFWDGFFEQWGLKEDQYRFE
jgi:hypothetical protein